MSNASKGAEIERRAIHMLEAYGYRVHRTIRSPILKWPGPRVIGSHPNDLFGVYDMVGTHATLGKIWLQTTVGGEIRRRQRKVEAVLQDFTPGDVIEVWGWVGGAKRRDRRRAGAYLRRQYFRRYRWSFMLKDWLDVTPPTDGWIDGYQP